MVVPATQVSSVLVVRDCAGAICIDMQAFAVNWLSLIWYAIWIDYPYVQLPSTLLTRSHCVNELVSCFFNIVRFNVPNCKIRELRQALVLLQKLPDSFQTATLIVFSRLTFLRLGRATNPFYLIFQLCVILYGRNELFRFATFITNRRPFLMFHFHWWKPIPNVVFPYRF